MQEKDSPQHQPPVTGRSWLPLGIGVAFVMIVIFSLFALKLMGTIEQQNQQLLSWQKELEQDHKSEIVSLLGSRRLQIILLKGTSAVEGGYGRVLWATDRGEAILQLSHLSPSVDEQIYMLWAIRGADTLTVGVFSVDDSGTHFFKFDQPNFSEGELSFILTREQHAGKTKPAGEVVLSSRR